MEVLSRLLKGTEEEGFLYSFQAGSHVQGGLNNSHILFIDDTVLFCNAFREQLLDFFFFLIQGNNYYIYI